MAMRIGAVVFLCCLAIAGCSRTYSDGTYKGDTKHGLRDGQGTMYFKKGDVFTGAWSNDRMNGFGTMRYTNGETYEGAWVNGLRQGHGILTYTDGDRYTGEWAADQKKSCRDLGNQITKLQALPEVVYEGTVQASVDPKTSKLILTIPGKVNLRPVNKKCPAFSMKTLRIHANGRVPLKVFSMDFANPGGTADVFMGTPVVSSITLDNIGLEFRKAEPPMILAGKNGAVLEKVGAGFRLTKGRAYVCQAEP